MCKLIKLIKLFFTVPRTGEGTVLSILVLRPPSFIETNQQQKQLAVVGQSPTLYYYNFYY